MYGTTNRPDDTIRLYSNSLSNARDLADLYEMKGYQIELKVTDKDTFPKWMFVVEARPSEPKPKRKRR